MQEPVSIYDLPTPADALVELIRRRLELEVSTDDVKQARAGYIVRHGDMHYRLKMPAAQGLGLGLELMTYRCGACECWVTFSTEVSTIEDVADRIAHHLAAHAPATAAAGAAS